MSRSSADKPVVTPVAVGRASSDGSRMRIRPPGVRRDNAFGRGPRHRVRWRLNRSGTAGLCLVVLVTLLAAFAPLLAPHDYQDQQLPKVLLPPFWQAGADPAYPLGTDNLGRDELSRILF